MTVGLWGGKRHHFGGRAPHTMLCWWSWMSLHPGPVPPTLAVKLLTGQSGTRDFLQGSRNLAPLGAEGDPWVPNGMLHCIKKLCKWQAGWVPNAVRNRQHGYRTRARGYRTACCTAQKTPQKASRMGTECCLQQAAGVPNTGISVQKLCA